MMNEMTNVLVVGASGSIGRRVVAESIRAGYTTTALVRDPAQASLFLPGTRIAVGDLKDSDSLHDAVAGATGVVFTHGTHGADQEAAEAVDYGAVRNVLQVLQEPARIALMTSIYMTKPSPEHNWKRSSERLVRASGLPYTIVRPGWFDYNEADELKLLLLQGDTHWAGDPSDGGISRAQIAQVLIASLTSEAALGKTLELFAEPGPAPDDLDPLFDALEADMSERIDGIRDRDSLPLADEPQRVLADIINVNRRFGPATLGTTTQAL